MSNQLFADILVEVPGIEPGRIFQYSIPHRMSSLVKFGHRVRVPFGRRRVTGFIVGFGQQKTDAKIKNIIDLVDERPLFGEEQYALARWMAGYYLCDTVKALQAVVIPLLKGTASRVVTGFFCSSDAGEMEQLRQQLARRAPKGLAVLEAAAVRPGLTRTKLAEAAGVSTSTVDNMVAKGFLRAESETQLRDPYPLLVKKVGLEAVQLTDEQKKAVENINRAVQTRQHQVFLLHGVTGSGKTEVYLNCIERAVRSGRQAVTLVPEISLTPQMVRLFKARFGSEVAVLHSRMSDGERLDEWLRIERGDAPVVLGARSAVLAPVKDSGLIILDEEHEGSYKQEETPRYHARAVALYRTQRNRGVLVLGSATPSLESYCRALPGGSYKLIKLEKRIKGRSMPPVQVIDMRQELRSGHGGIFSRELLKELREKVRSQEQAIVFLNRRGLNTMVVCRECGLVIKCPHCEVSLTYHTDGRLRCHYCNYGVKAPRLCPDCGGRQLGYFGTGTQRVEKELQEALPEARILRMDADTTTRKGSHQRILDDFSGGAADILVGTQMIAKGLDMAGVTLVGVVNADVTLHMPDFRAGERTFQLLAQVAGRTGRGNKSGKVLIQTYTPDHYAVTTAARHDYTAFFNHEIALRRATGYPPFAKMVRLLVYGKDEAAVRQAAEKIRVRLDEFVEGPNGGKIYLVGPAPAPLSRLRQTYRWHIVVWSRDYGRLHRCLSNFWRSGGGAPPGKGIHMAIDVDPVNLM